MMVPTRQPESLSSGKAIPLGTDFCPGEYDVICGRGRRAARHVGNRRFKLVIQLYLDKYLRARTKSDKTLVVIEIVDIFRRVNGIFVKPDSKHKGQWLQIGNQLVREKVGHAIRDALSSKAGDVKNDNEGKMQFARFSISRRSESDMNDEVEPEQFVQMRTIDEIMAMSTFDFEKIESGGRVETSPSTSPVPISKETVDEHSMETSPSTSTIVAAERQCGYSMRRPMPVTRQRSDQFSPIKLEDMHNLDMSLFHAYLAHVAETFPSLNDKEPKLEDNDFQTPIDSEVDTEDMNADAEFASFVIDALSDDDDSQSAEIHV